MKAEQIPKRKPTANHRFKKLRAKCSQFLSTIKFSFSVRTPALQVIPQILKPAHR